MSDIVTRLRRWVIATDAVPASDLMDEAADEIERLRGYRDAAEADRDVAMLAAERLRSQPCPYVTGTVTRYCTLTPPTLTDAEREAVDLAMDSLYGVEDLSDGACARADAAADTLRGLLERTRNGSVDGRETVQ